MALILADRVRENSNVQGTGDATLLGSPTGFETFAARIGDGNTTYYTIAEEQGDQWEVGVGTYVSSTNKLQRTTILASSNSGSVVSFGQGNKDVFVTLPAEKVVVSDAVGTMAYQNANAVAITGGAINETTIGSTTPAAATFTTLTATGQTSLGGAAGSESLRVAPVVSAVNYLQIAGGTGTNGPTISCLGSSNTQTLSVSGRGTAGGINLSSSGIYFAARGVSGSATVNYLQATSSITSNAPALSTQGSDTNIDLALTPKGTGLVRFGTYTAGVPIATGYISIKAANGTTYKVLVGT